jgi:heme exporter protein D
MIQKGMFEELFLGYCFILILSDSLFPSLVFAKNAKNIYITMLAFAFLVNREQFKPYYNGLAKIFIPFFIFSFFTVYLSIGEPFILTSFQKTLSYFLTFLVIPNFVSLLYRQHGLEFFKRLVFFCFTSLLIGFMLKFSFPSIAYIQSGRYRGVMGNPNGLGIYVFLIFIFFYIIDHSYNQLFSRRQRIIIYLSIIFSVLMSDSRNALIAMVIFYFFAIFYKRSSFLGFIICMIIMFIAQVVSTNLTTILISLGLGNFFRVATIEDGSGRYVAWHFAWQEMQKNLFIGKGFGYNEFYMRQHYDLLSKLGHQGGIHNSFLTFWMDQGLIGLLIYLRSYIIIFMKGAKKMTYAYPIMLAISFTAFFESWLVGSLSIYALLAMVIYTVLTNPEIVVEVQQQQQRGLELTEYAH